MAFISDCTPFSQLSWKNSSTRKHATSVGTSIPLQKCFCAKCKYLLYIHVRLNIRLATRAHHLQPWCSKLIMLRIGIQLELIKNYGKHLLRFCVWSTPLFVHKTAQPITENKIKNQRQLLLHDIVLLACVQSNSVEPT